MNVAPPAYPGPPNIALRLTIAGGRALRALPLALAVDFRYVGQTSVSPPFEPISTAAGTLHGRDCITLHAVAFTPAQRTLVVSGTVDGNLCSRHELTSGHALPFAFLFDDVAGLRVTELDEWLASERVPDSDTLARGPSGPCRTMASFYEIPLALPGPRNLCVLTYDDVLELGCSRFRTFFPTILERGPINEIDLTWYQSWQSHDIAAQFAACLGPHPTILSRAQLYSHQGFLRWSSLHTA